MKEPYKGLRPYEEADQDNFFGREVEKQILVDKILTNKLTLLFAASGVGKSSLLQAAVMPELKRPDRENLTVVYYNDWVEDPRVTLRNTLFESLTATQPVSASENLAEITTLPEFLHVATLFIPNQPLVIILDQFEEFFNYQRYSQYFRPFIQQLTQAILDYRTATVFVIAMREDFALELNAFKPELPTLLFENFYRLERLTIDNAKQAIVTPLTRFGFRYEDGLLETLIKDLSQREQLDRFGKAAEVVETHLVVEPPNLQIVCMQLWEIDKNNSQHQLTRATYESQGRARGLLKNYFRKQITQFSATEKQLASAAFNYLVNKHGTKMAYPVGDLARLLRVDAATLTQTLDKLEQARVLRRQIRLNTTDQGERRILWYELYHDIFSKSIYDWNESYKNRQRLIRLALGAILVVSAAGAIVLGYDAWINHTSYHVRLSLKSGISDTIELYQGQAGARDIFRQQAYLYETDYNRADIEADKLFNHQSVETLGQLNKELVEKFRLTNRLQAYWDDGEFSKTTCLANILKNDNNLLTATLTSLTHFRSVKSFERLKQFVQRGDQRLKATIQSTLLNIQAPPGIWFTLQQEPLLYDVATLALAHLGYQETVNDLVKLLKNSDSAIRNSAVEALGVLQAQSAIPQLIESLQDADWNVRNSAVQALGTLQAQAAIPQLLEWLQDADWNVRNSAAWALGQLQAQAAIPQLIESLQDADWNVRNSAAQALGTLQAQAAIPQLIESLQDADWNVRYIAAWALGQLQAPAAIPQLIEWLQNADPTVRNSAVVVLGQLQAQAAIPALIELLKDSHWQIRDSTAQALGQLQAQAAIPQLIESLQNANSDVRNSAVEALGQLQASAAIPQLIELLQNADSTVRNSAVEALGQLQAPAAIPQLIESLQDADSTVRNSAAQALGQLQAPAAIPQLIEWLQDADWNVRNSAAQVLGQLQAPAAIPQLIERLKDTKSDVRNSAAQALGTLQAPAAIPQLIERLKDTDSDVRNSAVRALGQLRTDRAITPLIKLFNQEKDPDVRQSIALVLVDWGNEEAINALIELLKSVQAKVTITPKPLQAHRWQTFITRLQQEEVTTQHRALKLFETIPTELAINAISQLPPLLAANATRYKTLQLLRTIIPVWSAPRDKFPGLAQIEAILNEPPEKDPATGAYHEKLANQFVALKILGELELEATAASLIKLIEPIPKYPNNLLELDVYAALGNIPGNSSSLDFLKERLEKIDQAKREWRQQRDQTEVSVKSTTTDPCQSQNFSDDKGKWRYPQDEFELGYAIARRDPQFGIKFLEHNLARVRNAAWIALGKIKDVELLKTLIQQRATSSDKPHFRHAAYRAIDNMLITLEYEGNNADLAALRNFLPQVEDAATQDRIQWTIYQLEYRCERLKSCE